jgi:hypothetical protein
MFRRAMDNGQRPEQFTGRMSSQPERIGRTRLALCKLVARVAKLSQAASATICATLSAKTLRNHGVRMLKVFSATISVVSSPTSSNRRLFARKLCAWCV